MSNAAPERVATISYGGGVQSTALLVLAANRDPEFEEVMGGPVTDAVFANVGDDSEHPATLEFVRNVATPWAAERGVTVHEVSRVRRDGTVETLWGRLTREGSRSLPIPIRMDNGAPGRRSCTADFKIHVLGKWLKAHGASADNPATVAIGISTDEIQRLNNKRVEAYERPVYPLVEMGWDRSQCQQLNIDTFGVAVPKSSCFFCPFHRPHTWAVMARDEPDLFQRSVDLERLLNDRRAELGKDRVWLTRFARPLNEAVAPAQEPLFRNEYDGPEGCDEGHCWT